MPRVRPGSAQCIGRYPAVSRLLLADEFFFVAHNDVTGKPRQHARALGLGLGAALLGEMMLLRRITIDRGSVVVIDGHPPGDLLGHIVLDQLLSEPAALDVRSWLAYLGQTARQRVGERLERFGRVARTPARRLKRSGTHWIPVSMSDAAMPTALLRHALKNEHSLDDQTAILAGLIDAAGLDETVLWGLSHRTLQYRDWNVATLMTPLRDLIIETGAAVGNTVLTHRA